MRQYRDSGYAAATHWPVLMRVIEASSGPILECGTGKFSSPILRTMAYLQQRHVEAYDSDPDWYAKAKELENGYYRVHLIKSEDWPNLPIDQRYGLVFVDQAPTYYRRVTLRRFANNADYLVVHDSEIGAQRKFHLERTLQTFRYRFDYAGLRPHTSVVSNVIDVVQLYKAFGPLERLW